MNKFHLKLRNICFIQVQLICSNENRDTSQANEFEAMTSKSQ